MPKNQTNINVYYVSHITQNQVHWKLLCRKHGRPLETVFMNDIHKHNLLADIHDFLSSKDWYVNRNIPYRRGYLLHGQTGTGKSSLITAICSELGLGIYLAPLSSPRFNDNNLVRIFNSVPAGQLILVEDIDKILCSPGKRRNKSSLAKIKTKLDGITTGKTTMPGLLNALDGPVAHTDHIVFFTCSNIAKINQFYHDFKRPGRIDVVMEMELANKNMIKNMFKHFYSDYDHNLDALAENYARLYDNHEVPMCVIQNDLIQHKNDPSSAI